MDRLARFIRTHANELVHEWAIHAGAVDDGDRERSRGGHVSQVLDRLVERLEGKNPAKDALTDLATANAVLCYRRGVVLADVIGGYSLLRHVLLTKYSDAEVPQLRDRLHAIDFLNDCIDGAISTAVEQFAHATARDREFFIAIVNHDLGNEVSAVSVLATTLANDVHLPRHAHDRAVLISESTKVMARMLADLGDFAQVQFGGRLSISPQRCDACSLCRRVADGMSSAAPGREIGVRCAGPVSGSWDPDRLTQLVRNLVANAIHHGHGPILISVAPTGDGSSVELTVANHGPIISPERLETLFDPRARESAQSPSTNGAKRVGLGLYIVKTIAEAHGGSVTVESTTESGTTFTVRLPLDSGATATARA